MFPPSGGAETVVTADEGVRGGKTIPLKATVDEAVEGCECVRRVMVATRTGANVPMVADRDLRLEEVIECVCVMMTCCYSPPPPPQEMSKEASECAPVPLDSEDPLFMLHTSGSTGKPKGILHTQAGYLLMAGLTQQVHTHTYSSSSCSLSSTLSMCLTIILRMYLHVWQTLVGSLVTPMLCMVHSVMEVPLYCLRALLCTLIPVSSN